MAKLAQKVQLQKRVFSSEEMQQFSPHHVNLEALQAGDKSCSVAPKMGYWFVGCYIDKDPDQLRTYYSGKAEMTPQVCFDHCQWGHNQGFNFFFLKNGRECSCARYYHKGGMGGLGGCTMPCGGDSSKFCGGKAKESVYQMHDCNAAAYKPMGPGEGRKYQIDLTGNGAEFFTGPEQAEVSTDSKMSLILSHQPDLKLVPGPNGTSMLQARRVSDTDLAWSADTKKGLRVVIIDPHNGESKTTHIFYIDGFDVTKPGQEPTVTLAESEAEAFRNYVWDDSLRDDIVMVAAAPDAFTGRFTGWWNDVKQGLVNLGCPVVEQPPQGEVSAGYTAICAGHADGATSDEVQTAGFVAGYRTLGTNTNTEAYYMIDCVMTEFVNEGSCSLTCGGGLQKQVREVFLQDAHGGAPCPVDRTRNVNCNMDPCPVDCGYSEWTAWGRCDADCGPGTKMKSRMVTNEPEHGGVPCVETDANLLRDDSCQIVPCPIHAEWDEWQEWSSCSEFCGDGINVRERVRKVHAQWGGNDVEGPFTEERGCFLKHCPVDCEITAWVDEGECSLTCGTGQQKQTREITVAAAHGGEECPADLVQHLPCNENPCPVDCVMSEFADEGGCSLTCGGGKQLMTRYVKEAMAHGGVPCPRTMEKYVPCNSDKCPIDCVFSLWSGWQACDHDCGPGNQARHRIEEVVAKYGGYPCEGPKEQEMSCQVVPCPIDCEWGEWAKWTECDEDCGPGKKERARSIEVHNQWGGRPCDGAAYEEEKCEKVPCPVECEVSEWADEGTCDKKCGGGKQLQVRKVETDAKHGGECPTDMNRLVECNTHPCPIECEMSNWISDGDCSLSCGSGEIKEARVVLTEAQYGAEACPSDHEQIVGCNDQPCPVDCEWSIWSGWSPCSTFCGPGIATRTRRITQPAAYAGVECVGVDYEEQSCQARECPIDCEFADWQEWSECDEKCGPGEKFRVREEAISAMHGGMACLGDYNDETACQVVECPIDCQITQWEKTGDCSLTCGGGLQDWGRRIMVQGVHGGVACPDDMSKQEPCNEHSCPVDCVLSDWLPDGDCTTSCGGGLQKEVKDVTIAPAYGGAVCGQPQQQYVSCNEDPCPINCVWDAWGGWTTCSEDCGAGTQTRHRGKWTEMAHSGAECSGPDNEERTCEIIPCPIDCVWEDWGGWSVCDEECGPGSQSRTRGPAVVRQYGGAPCDGDDYEEQDCQAKECPVECEVSEWGVVSGCDQECGGGQMREERTIVVSAQHGAEACPTDLEKTVSCNAQACPVDCVLSGWIAASTCSQSCGGGKLHEVKKILVATAHGGGLCHPEQERWVDCNEEACPVDCKWGSWTGWSPCSAACGTGSSERTRVHEITVAHGGVACSGGFAESQECTGPPCAVDGAWADWREWGVCDEQCGWGWQFRTRGAAVEPAYGGRPLEGPSEDYQKCKDKECPVDCEVGNWYTVGECSVSCGGGTIEAKRDVSQEALHDGAGCPADLTRTEACNDLPCPVDCQLSEWAEVSACSVTCGGGVIAEKRSILVAPANNGVTCDAPLQRDVACAPEECPVDCVWGEWTGFSGCSASCGIGAQDRTREHATVAAHGGVECEGAAKDERSCELASCPVDCAWGDWAEWTGCSEPCGPGETSRARQYHTPAEFGGAPCEGSFDEVDECEAEKCPVDCIVSDWAFDDTACSVTCGGGTRTEIREVTQPTQYNGAECPTNLARTVNCNDDACPIDCEMSEWADDSSCSVTCGEGELQQFRRVLTQPAHGGVACPETDGATDLTRTVDCARDPCPIDCQWGLWSGWEECSVTCGAGQRGRSRAEEVLAAHGGAGCIGASSEEEVCNDAMCPVHCAWADWAEWSGCSEECGVGQQSRARFESESAQYGGDACDGLASETVDCELKPCPVDCAVSAWATLPAAECTATCGGGLLAQGRIVTQAAAHGGQSCPTSLARDVVCGEDPCPIDCELAEWRPVGLCSKTCGGGEKKLVRDVATASAFGGEACPASDSADRATTEPCNEMACPVDCVVTEWAGWSTCSATCGDGTQTRTREVTTEAAHGGLSCPTDLEQDQDCNHNECPIDCAYGEWGDFSDCDAECGDGTKTRSREVATAAAHGGAPCTEPAKEAADCKVKECPVDCELGAWAAEGECSATCGGGLQKETRDVTTAKAHGGAECPTDKTRELSCNEDACPVDCAVGDWQVGECSATCGGGKMASTRIVTTEAAHGGAACPELEKEEDCGEAACPVNCQLEEWAAWGECSKSCGGGKTERARTVKTEPAHGGLECDLLDEKTGCNDVPCPVDCVVGDWAGWGECSASCGEEGEQSRSRALTDPLHGGAACPAAHETRSECPDLASCPVDCVSDGWEDVTECTRSCGGGKKTQQLKVTTEAAHGGLSCGATQREDVCNPAACPVDCVVSEWSHDGTCSRGCGGGVQHSRRFITTQTAHGGAACPAEADLAKSEACNTQACPAAAIGESGAKKLGVTNGGSSGSVTLNTNFASTPVVIAGPVPRRGSSDATATSVLQAVGRRPSAALPAPAPVKLPACECTGGPSNGVPMPNEASTQYPAAYGDYCAAWAARDLQAAQDQAAGSPELEYLGDGWAYNPVSKANLYVGGLVPTDKLKAGDKVDTSKTMGNLPDVDEDAGSVFPQGGEAWCYVSEGCASAVSDGWHTWAACGDGKAWDNQPAPGFPEVTQCPVAYAGAHSKMHLLTRKVSALDHDVCVGADEHNECHDGSSLGGAAVGYVSELQLADGMVQLMRAYNADAKDTCVFPAGQQAAFCKATGSYGAATELGYAFAAETPGTVKAEFKSSAAEQDSCLGLPGSQKDSCWSDASVVGEIHLLSTAHSDAWALCGSTLATEDKWFFEVGTSVDGEPAATDPNFEQVSWLALAQGVYETSDGTKFQAGISFVPAGSDFHTVQFHEAFGAAPVVLANALAAGDGSVPHLKSREADPEAFFVQQQEADVTVHWLAIEAKDGYLSSYPFSAGTVDEVGPDGVTIEWDDRQFFQTPLVFASVATARDEAAHVELRTTSNSASNVTFVLEGSETAEKVSYLVYNGQARLGSIFNAQPLLSMAYAFTVGGWGECANPAADAPQKGTHTRTVECKGTNDRVYEAAYCGEAPAAEQECCIPKVAADFAAGACGSQPDGCGGDVGLDECTYAFEVADWGDCFLGSAAFGTGTKSRTSKCVRSDSVTVEPMMCGDSPAASEECCVPATASAFEGKNCGAVADSCGGDVELGSCEHSCVENVCETWTTTAETPSASLQRGTWGAVAQCADGHTAVGAKVKVQAFQGNNALVAKWAEGIDNFRCKGIELASFGVDTASHCASRCDEQDGCTAYVTREGAPDAEDATAYVAGGRDCAGSPGAYNCLNGNTGYPTLAAAWAQCDAIAECGLVMKYTDGQFYLRRASDPVTSAAHGGNQCRSYAHARGASCTLYSSCEQESAQGYTAFKQLAPQDDSGVNAIELLCSDNTAVTSAEGSLGDWAAAATCDGIVAVRLRSVSDQGAGDTQDDVGTTGVEFKCADGSVLNTGSEGSEGTWSTWAECPKGGHVAGLKTQIDEDEKDKTGLNGLEVVCGAYVAA